MYVIADFNWKIVIYHNNNRFSHNITITKLSVTLLVMQQLMQKWEGQPLRSKWRGPEPPPRFRNLWCQGPISISRPDVKDFVSTLLPGIVNKTGAWLDATPGDAGRCSYDPLQLRMMALHLRHDDVDRSVCTSNTRCRVVQWIIKCCLIQLVNCCTTCS